MRLPSRLRSVLPALPILSALCVRRLLPALPILSALCVCRLLPALPILSALCVCRLLPALPILSAVLRLRRIQADVSVLSTGLRLWGVLSKVPILSGCALLVVGRPHSKTADWPHKRQATSAVTATALV